MGSDNLYHKRRAQASKPARRKGTRPPHDRVLIVCEGKKTEPNYFEELKAHYRLNSADIEIVGTDGASPENILKLAKRKYHAAKRSDNLYDRVYCVFDQDLWPCYGQVLEDILSATPKGTFFAANSAPCFEYWLLLHFEHTSRPYHQLSGKSPADQVVVDLKRYMPDYNKAARNLFNELAEQLEQAKSHAEIVWKDAGQTGTANPITAVHLLVEYLQTLNRQ